MVADIFEDFEPTPKTFLATPLLTTIIRFARYHLLLASNSTFMTDYIYLGTIQISRNLNEHFHDLTNIRKLFSIPVAEYTSFLY